ncbi:Tubulin-tyrosine ligase family protein [Trichomonas vaginalis G3]|uniref:Tubulin-tyrosine ligase family protein n=1 Tax=Trichomonas vaginalis (strain ATCC PRA-98 / G3) TaxID=412133 RepID=A2E8Z3_TRIV3|nr:positive regulation of cilium movement [Trichomonas vaginalis G3]EAY10877.1 Tubulin-tyrosine ligase family protein [Trichomonas vaginalis G3]KAI5482924.1 positive regulation of cilium movement [Trichomonas vaginalis G3]|eukprot:XP_001323100.1 Tubulin-tyrosine ligase family protein [Trichomonas vaginalis G3]
MALRVASGKILFGTVIAAITKAGASIVNNEKDKESCPIVWYDTLHEQDHDMQGIKPWQLVNRLPGINYICRKAPLFRLLNRMSLKLPAVYNFFPKSYIVPQEYQQFLEDRKSSNKKYIYKPNNGSLGNGIVIIKPETKFNYQKSSAVIQEFVESALINNTKFDLRIYALVASIHPLRIYVYRDGIARFCSAPNSTDSQFGQITNTAVNRKNPNHVSIEQITKTVSETFAELERVTNTQVLWGKIDRIIVLSVISSLKILRLSEIKYCPAHLFQQCFQLLGFDILIDKNYEPKILEVNYRPSLAANIAKESSLKIDMLSTLIKIMTPPQEHIVKLSTMSEEQINNMFNKKAAHPEILQDIVREGRSLNKYICVYPTNDNERMVEYKLAMNVVSKMSGSIDSRGNIPFMDVTEQVKEENQPEQIKENVTESKKLSARESKGNVSARKSLNNISVQKKTEFRAPIVGESLALKKTPLVYSHSREKDLTIPKHQKITVPSSHYTSRRPIHRATHLLPK